MRNQLTYLKLHIEDLLLTIWGSIFAQETWTLEECVTFALEHNLQLNDVEYTNQSNKETYRQSIRNLLPSVNASGNYNISFGRAEDPNTGTFVNQDFYSNNYSLESSIDLFQGFQKINSIKASKFLYKATQEEVLQQKYLLAFRVMQAFYDIQFFKGLVAISKEQLSVSQSNYNLVEKQIELGLKAGADLYEAESLLLTDKLNVTQSNNQLASAKLTLIQEMNLENTSDISIQEDLGTIAEVHKNNELKSDSIYDEAREFLPLIKAQELRAKAAKKQVAISRGRLYPSLSLFAGVGTGYFETTRDTLGNTLPFREQAIQQLVQDYNSLLVELVQSNQKMEAQNLAFTIAQKRYEKGMINALELFTAKNLFASAQNENLQVKLRSEINKSTLDFYRGLPVFNIN